MEKLPLSELPARLIPAFREKARRLPWRESPTPYHVWLSEIMLQQTRIEAVIPYYLRFLSLYPDVFALAVAPDDELMKAWEGLGYYSRARNLKKSACILTENSGEFPRTADELAKLPGIGDYTAGAIASIAFGEPAPAVDGNVLRVVARYLADTREVTDPAVKKEYKASLQEVYPTGRDAALFTQALMELGETICIPNGVPDCAHCPLNETCRAHAMGNPETLPRRAAKKPRAVTDLTVFLFTDGAGRTAIRKRPASGLLASLYEFPNETGHFSKEQAFAHAQAFGLLPLTVTPLPAATHIFTHREWHMTGYRVTVEAVKDGQADDLFFATPAEIENVYAIASAFRAYKNEVCK